jgi:hypothetical protein
MSLKKIPIADADYNQLLAHAQTIMGLDVKKGIQTANLLAKIREAEPDITEIFASDVVVVQQAQPAPLKNEALLNVPAAPLTDKEMQHYRYDPKVKVNIMIQDGKVGGKAAVPISVNGEQIVVNRGVEVEIPYRFYLNLVQAWESTYEATYPDGDTKPCVLKETRQLSYPFSHGPLPSDEDIAAWQERTSKISVQLVGKTPAAQLQEAA